MTLHAMSQVHRRGSQSARRRLVFVAAAVGALTSCAGDSNSGAHATVLQVDLGRFVIEPAVLEALAGDVELHVTNVDPDLAHDLVVNGKGTRRLAPGQSQTVEIAGVLAGEYRMWCDVPGHANAGQVGTLVINPAPSPTVASP